MKLNVDRLTQSIKTHLPNALKELGRRGTMGVQLAGTIGLLGAIGSSIVPTAQAQVPITGLNASYLSGTPSSETTTVANPAGGGYTPGAAITLNFGVTTSNDRYIQTFLTGSGTTTKQYNFSGLVSNIYIRRNATSNPASASNRQIAFFERSSPTDMISSFTPDMASILRSQTINRGTDNLFTNQKNAAGNNNNIERVDFVTPDGLTAPNVVTQLADIGFLVLERNGNDTVKIAAITAIDGAGNPTAYGPVITQTSSQWGSSGISLDYAVMRRDNADTTWHPSDRSNQSIKGIYFPFSSLGVTIGQTIYGYSIIPADVTAVGPDLLDWLNATNYPTNTSDQGTVGIDLMAGGGIFITHVIAGTVFSDPNGNKIQDIPAENGPTPGIDTLKAVLLDSTGKVIRVVPVNADGTYKFSGVATPLVNNPYTVLVTTTTPALNSTNPVITLPTGFVSTGENKENTPDATVDTRVTVTKDDFTTVSGQPLLTEARKINFGIKNSSVTSPPELILLKRITKINGLTTAKKADGTPIDLTLVVSQPDNPLTPRNESSDASNPGWIANYPKGAIDAGVIKSGDRIEYTIYFLSIGGKPVTNANFCDWVPKYTSFVPDAYGLGRGIQLAIGSILNTFTNVPDSDRGVFYSPSSMPPATYPNGATYKLNCMTPAGTEGAVVVNLVNNTLTAPDNQLPNATAAGTPDNSYGFVRFVSKVK